MRQRHHNDGSAQAYWPRQRMHCGIADSLHASSNGVSAAPPTRPILESHAWDATYMRAPTEQPYRSTKFPAVPNRLRIFAGTSNPVSFKPLPLDCSRHLSASCLPGSESDGRTPSEMSMGVSQPPADLETHS